MNKIINIYTLLDIILISSMVYTCPGSLTFKSWFCSFVFVICHENAEAPKININLFWTYKKLYWRGEIIQYKHTDSHPVTIIKGLYNKM